MISWFIIIIQQYKIIKLAIKHMKSPFKPSHKPSPQKIPQYNPSPNPNNIPAPPTNPLNHNHNPNPNLNPNPKSQSPLMPIIPQNPLTPKSPKFTLPIPTITLITKFQSQIKSQICLMQQIHASKQPQKCLTHSLPYTLYCQTDHKMMCSRCMFQNNAHKLHNVKPLAQALQNINGDINKLQTEVQTMINGIQNKKRELGNQKEEIQRQYPNAKDGLENIFKQLHQVIFQVENACMKELRLFKSMLLEKNQSVSHQIEEIINYLQQEIKKCKKKLDVADGNPNQFILLKKNILNVMIKSEKIVNEQLQNSNGKNNRNNKSKTMTQKNTKNNRKQIYKYQPQCVPEIKRYLQQNIDTWMPWRAYLLHVPKLKQANDKSQQKVNQRQGNTIRHRKYGSRNNLHQNNERENEDAVEVNAQQNLATKSKQKSKFFQAKKPLNLVDNITSKSLQSIMRSKSQLFQKNSLLITNNEDKKRQRSKSKLQNNKNKTATTQNLLQSLNNNLSQLLNENKNKSSRKKITKLLKYQKQFKPLQKQQKQHKQQKQSSKSFIFNKNQQVNRQKIGKTQIKQKHDLANKLSTENDNSGNFIKTINKNKISVNNISKSKSKSKGKNLSKSNIKRNSNSNISNNSKINKSSTINANNNKETDQI